MTGNSTEDLRRRLEAETRAFYNPPWWQRLAAKFCGHNAMHFAQARVVERRIKRVDKRIRGKEKR